jgi:hypothetical protein
MKLRGFYQYFGLVDCVDKLNLVRYTVVRMWKRTFHRQGQRCKVTWEKMRRSAVFELPYPRTVHATV